MRVLRGESALLSRRCPAMRESVDRINAGDRVTVSVYQEASKQTNGREEKGWHLPISLIDRHYEERLGLLRV